MSKPLCAPVPQHARHSPHRYVMRRYVEKARQLLQSSSTSLVDIAFELGLASQSHLNRIFQETYGVTPGDVRKHLQRKPVKRAKNEPDE